MTEAMKTADAVVPVAVIQPTDAPVPVAVMQPTDAPVPVTVVASDVPMAAPPAARIDPLRPFVMPRQSQTIDPSMPATTTYQQDLTQQGQRTVNLIWETTQGRIALYVILGTMVIDGLAILSSIVTGREMTAATALAIGFVNSLATGVVSFYFSRTNHTQIGGVGEKPNEPYKGR